MSAASGVLTIFRSISRVISSEVASTSGSQYLERIALVAPGSTSAALLCHGVGSCSMPAGLLQSVSKLCMHSHAGSFATAQKLVHNTRTSPFGSLRTLFMDTTTHTFGHQHSFRTQASAKSLWQRLYYTSGFGYRRSYSIWDGDNVLYGLIAANLAGFLLWQSYPGLMYRYATVSVNSVREGRVYTLLTSAFSHKAFGHILANMFTLYFFGRNMSHVLGGKKLLLLYLAGGLAGSLAHVTQYYIQAQSTGAAEWIKQARMASSPVALGASAAVNAIVMLQVMLYPREMVYIYMVLPIPAAAFGLLYIFGDMFGLLGCRWGRGVT
ncbi:hypothetical protein ABBQ38_003746 [Trebouxia sp. C0009 RCD-2024]